VTEADLAELGAQFTDPVGFSQMAAERSVVSFQSGYSERASLRCVKATGISKKT
jgi:hypothetical protein